MIGLLGSFGVGKSSVVELLGKLLAGDKDYSLIRVSAERHEIENFHRSFVFAVAEAIVDRDLASRYHVERIISRLEYSTTQSWSDFRLSSFGRLIGLLGNRLRSKLGKRLLAIGGIVMLILGIVTTVLVVNGFFATDTASRALAWLGTSIGTIAATLTAVPLFSFLTQAASHASPFKPGQSTSMRPRAEAADEYERVFASLIELVKSRLVIAVDDVDRLDQREILPALNAIRSFQLTVPAARQPTFIVSLDDKIIAPALVAQRQQQGGAGEDDSDLLIDEYLNRLFTLRQAMPLHAKRDLRSYARELLVSSNHRGAEKLGSSLETVLNILVHDEVQSPRHVIRLLNAFFADYRLAIRREASAEGRRAISSGLVTSAPAVLARMTVLKSDFPKFFGALVVDTRLLKEVEDDVRGDLDTESSADVAARTGAAAGSVAYASLKRFIGRTATWTEPIDDLLPFLYLGQDSLERSMGSADVRRALAALSNRQIADFGALLENAQAADEGRKNAYIESIVDAARSLEGLELANALATIGENAASATKLSSSIADVFADGLFRAPNTHLSTQGLAIMLGAVSADLHREVIARALADVPEEKEQRDDWIISVLDHDQLIASDADALADVRSALGRTLASSVTQGRLPDLEMYTGHLREDSDPAMAELVLSSALDAIAKSENDLTDSFAEMMPTAAAALEKHTLSSTLKSSASAAIRGGATTNGALSALRLLEAVDLTDPQQLADLTWAWTRSATVETRDALAEGFESKHLDWSEWLLARSVRLAPGFRAQWGAKKDVPVPRQVAEVLALSIDEWGTAYPSGNAIATVLIASRPADVSALVASTAKLLVRATEVLDDEERELFDTILAHAGGLSEVALTPLREALKGALSIGADADLRDQIVSFLPHVRDNEDWATWLERLIVETAAAANQTLATCEAAAAVVLAASPTAPSTASAEAVLDLVRSRMIPYRHNALAVHTVGNFAWPDTYRAQALEAIAPILEAGDNAALEGSFAHLRQTPRGALTASAVQQFLATGTSRLQPEITAQMLHHLSLAVAFSTALDLGEAANQSMIEAVDSAPTADVSQFIASVPAAWALRASSTASDLALLSAVASREETAFVEGTVELVTDFMASDDSSIVPERLGEIVEACNAVATPVSEILEENLRGAAHEVLAATKLLPSVGFSAILDRSLADSAAGALRDWSRERVDRDVATRIARAIRLGPASKAAALKVIGPGGPRKEPAKSIYISVRDILRGA